LGKRLSVLVEGTRDRKTGFLRGFSRNYIPVFIQGPDALIGKEIMVRIAEVNDTAVYGEMITL
jgi:tRNA A37 methylthiotransferase MiaB